MDNNRHGTQQLHIVHWNSRSIIPKLGQLQNFINSYDVQIDIILINETWLSPDKAFKVTGYNIIRQDSDRPHGGVAVLIRDKFKFFNFNLNSCYDLQNILVSVELGTITLDILSVYIPPPPNGKFNIHHLNAAFSYIKSKHFIVIGDFNAHHTAWGCRNIDRRGNIIHSFVDSLNLVCLNDHNITTLAPFGQQGNVLDLVFASPHLSSSCSFDVLDDPMSSNHYPLLVGVLYNSVQSFMNSTSNADNSVTSESDNPLAEINFKKIDWRLFYEKCQENFSSFTITNVNIDPLELYNEFVQRLVDILLTFSKNDTVFKRQRSKSLIWWNDVCSQAVQQAKIALNSFRTYPSLENYIIYKQFDAKKKRVLSEQKLLSWVNLCSSFNRKTSTKIIWDFIRRYKFSKLNTQSKSKFFDDPNNVLLFLDKITSSSTINIPDSNRLNLQLLFRNKGLPSASWLIDPFKFHELQAALLHKKNTSPGPDFISYKVIQSLPDYVKKILLVIYNKLWDNGLVPTDWKSQYVVPILKPHKDANSVDAYRPISLTSCFAKCFETMLKNRLDWFIENHLLIPEYQFGFRKGKSTMFNLACLVGDIKNNLLSNKCTLAVFLDIKGAFDNIDHEYLIKSLSNLGLPGHVLKWLYHFLNGRCLFVKYKNKLYGPRYSFRGTPQGSVLSPLIFILSLVDFMRQIPNSVKYSFYADDLVIYLGCNDPKQGQDVMNTSLMVISDLLKNQLKLEVNVTKSAVILFTRNCAFVPKIWYESSLLPLKHSERYLGLILDSELNWKVHIEHLTKRTELGLNIMRSLAGLSWGSDPKVLKILYITTVRSHFDYGCMFFNDANYHFLRKLDVIQNKALRIISGAMMSSPINSLEVEVGVAPLIIRRSYIIDRFCLQLVSRDNVVTGIYLQNYIRPNFNQSSLSVGTNISHSVSYLNFQFQDVVFWSRLLPCFNQPFHSLIFDIPITLTRFQSKFDFLEFLDSKKDFGRIYTDGSKTKTRTSFAFYDAVSNNGKVFECSNYFSIFSAEVLALIYALLYIKSNCYNCKKFIILSDSMSALQSLSSKKISANFNYLVYLLRTHVFDLLYKCNTIVEFCWVPGHSGIWGNELVDSLTKLTENAEFCNFGVPYTDLHSSLKSTMFLRWSISLNNSRNYKGKWLTDIQSVPSTTAWFEKSNVYLGRKFITCLSRLRIGHCRFPAHLFRLNLLNNSSCIYCSFEPSTLDHLFFNCPVFNLQRLLFICSCKDVLNSNVFPLSVQDLLKNYDLYPSIFDFVNNTFGPL